MTEREGTASRTFVYSLKPLSPNSRSEIRIDGHVRFSFGISVYVAQSQLTSEPTSPLPQLSHHLRVPICVPILLFWGFS